MHRITVILDSNANGVLPPSDRAAVGLAIRRLSGGVRAFALREDEAALRYARAAGASSASVLTSFDQLDFDAALVGEGGCGAWGDLLPAKLAAERGAALVLNVIDVEATDGGWRVTRNLGRGAKEILRVRGPVVLGISDEAPQRMYVSQSRRQAVATRAASAATTLIDPHAYTATAWEPTRARTRAGNLAAKTGGAATDRFNMLVGAAAAGEDASEAREIIQSDAATCAKHLLRYLRHHGFAAGADLEPSPYGRGQGEGITGLQGLTSEKASGRKSPERPHDQEHLNVPSPQPSPKGRGGKSSRLLRGPRSVTGEATGIARRPRALEPISANEINLPPCLARHPRGLNQTTPRARGPFPFPFKGPNGSSPHA